MKTSLCCSRRSPDRRVTAYCDRSVRRPRSSTGDRPQPEGAIFQPGQVTSKDIAVELTDIIRRAWRDAEFKRQLLADPRGSRARAGGGAAGRRAGIHSRTDAGRSPPDPAPTAGAGRGRRMRSLAVSHGDAFLRLLPHEAVARFHIDAFPLWCGMIVTPAPDFDPNAAENRAACWCARGPSRATIVIRDSSSAGCRARTSMPSSLSGLSLSGRWSPRARM